MGINYDYIELAPAPYDEQCAQVGEDDYAERSVKECVALMHQLTRQLGEPPASAYYSVKTFPHDFGSYKEVVINYDPDNEEARRFAIGVDRHMPAKWDKEALEELSR